MIKKKEIHIGRKSSQKKTTKRITKKTTTKRITKKTTKTKRVRTQKITLMKTKYFSKNYKLMHPHKF